MKLINLPSEFQITLYLLREELKIRKFFNTLRDVGFTDCDFEPDLSFLIIKSVGLDDGKDETFYWFSDLMDKRSKKIKRNYDSIMKQALKVYHELMSEKQKRKAAVPKS